MKRAAKVGPVAAKAAKAVRQDGAWVLGHASGAGFSRRYRLFRPAGIASTERLPMLVMLHGCGQNAQGFATSTRMNALATKHRFLVLYPEQDRVANSQGCWNWFETRSGRAFVEASSVVQAIDQVHRLYPVDPQRVALAGLSAGASLAGLVALRYPDRFTAVCMHSGVAPGAAQSSATALAAMRGRRESAGLSATAALPPLLVVQGSEDRVVAPSNASSLARLWADAAGVAAGAPRRLQRGQRYPMTVTNFGPSTRPLVSLCEVLGLGHAWSGGAAREPHSDPSGPDAAKLVVAFVARGWKQAPRVVASAVARALTS